MWQAQLSDEPGELTYRRLKCPQIDIEMTITTQVSRLTTGLANSTVDKRGLRRWGRIAPLAHRGNYNVDGLLSLGWVAYLAKQSCGVAQESPNSGS